MQRRKFIAGVGSLAAGAAAVTGTGAVSSVTADRDANLTIATDANAYLGLKAGSNAGPYVTQAGDGTIQFNFDGSGTGASGLNNRADTTLDQALEVQNQTDRTLYVWAGFANPNDGSAIDPTSGGARSVELLAGGGDKDITFPGDGTSKGGATSRTLGQTTTTGAISLGSGQSMDVDVRLLVYGSNDPRDASFLTVFQAQEDDPNGTSKSDHEFSVNVN